MLRCLVVTLSAVLAGRAAAQADLLLPPAAAGIEQTDSSPRPWGQGAAPTRTMVVYNEAQFAAQGVSGFVQIDGLRWRANGGGGAGAGTYTNVEVWLSSAATTYLTMSNTFALNHGGDLTLVYSGPVSVQAATPTSPSSFYVDVTFSTPFAYFTGTDLVVEVKCTGAGWSGPSAAAVDVAMGAGAGSMLTAIGVAASSGALITNSAPVLQLVTPATPAPTLVINEFVYDPIGLNREFIEIYNAGASAINLAGWTLRATTSSGTTVLVALAAVVLSPGQHYVVGNSVGVAPVLLVDQALAAALPNGHATLSLRNLDGAVVDAVRYGASAGAAPVFLGDGAPLFGAHRLDPASPTSWSRHRDGFDTGLSGNDFRVAPWTPGFSNDQPDLRPYGATFDALVVGTPVPSWVGSTAAPVAANPLALGTFHPKVVPVSPQGGNCMVFATPGDAAGGRSYLLQTDSDDASGLRGLVYFDATLAPPGQSYAWSIGVGGTTDSDYAMPLPTSPPGGNTNGNTGVSWTYRVTDSAATLYLVSHGPGGRVQQVLDSHAVTTSAWRPLQLDVVGGRVFASYDGQLTQAFAAASVGGWYVGIRNQAPGAALAALRVDDAFVDDGAQDFIADMGGSCDGNCPPKNSDAKKINRTEKYTADGIGAEFPPGDYAIPIEPLLGLNPLPYSFEVVCVLTDKRSGVSAVTSTLELLDGTMEDGPGATLRAPTTLADPQANGDGWWFVDVAPVIGRDTLMFVSFHYDGTLDLPVPADGARVRSAYWYRPPSGTWELKTAQEPWSVKLKCADTSTTAEADLIGSTRIGTVFTPRLSSTFTGTLGVLWLALTPLPGIDLGFLGAPDCKLYVDIGRGFGSLGITDASGGLQFPILLANDPLSLGLQVYEQWFVYDPTVNPLGFISSNGLSTVIH
ncbi:MAG: lamin tail domain-containing protein [Planctomycetes bacterium]|nr:lamin tail domain-containing protein [Planctomycetota bacterium]